VSVEVSIDCLPVAEAIKRKFDRFGRDLQYDHEKFRFAWCGEAQGSRRLPTEAGVYCLFSHDASRIQKIGKTESMGGLRARFNQYTGRKTEQKLARDQTDQRWRRIMMGELNGEPLQLFYFVTPPIMRASPIREAAGQLSCHWARSFEIHLAAIVRREYERDGLLNAGTHLLLSNAAI
jgi:hypothetical protein